MGLSVASVQALWHVTKHPFAGFICQSTQQYCMQGCCLAWLSRKPVAGASAHHQPCLQVKCITLFARATGPSSSASDLILCDVQAMLSRLYASHTAGNAKLRAYGQGADGSSWVGQDLIECTAADRPSWLQEVRSWSRSLHWVSQQGPNGTLEAV